MPEFPDKKYRRAGALRQNPVFRYGKPDEPILTVAADRAYVGGHIGMDDLIAVQAEPSHVPVIGEELILRQQVEIFLMNNAGKGLHQVFLSLAFEKLPISFCVPTVSRRIKSLPCVKGGAPKGGGIVKIRLKQSLSQPFGLPAPLTQGSLCGCCMTGNTKSNWDLRKTALPNVMMIHDYMCIAFMDRCTQYTPFMD